MRDSRDIIFSRLKTAVPPAVSLPSVPLFDGGTHNRAQLSALFCQSLIRMGGRFLEPEGDSPLACVHKLLEGVSLVCSAVAEIEGDFPLSAVQSPHDLAVIEYGVIRASFGVAETGSVCLTEKNLGVNALGYLPQHLIILLDPEEIVYNIHNAYHRPEWKENNYAAFHTGPSATADIEGVLIHGAQGVRSLSVAFVPASYQKKL
ncbi:LutC/YkgG family protein [Entomobacter blattae]|uniref:LutC/YkgG family protein n=1 Tax=Entomobacter blattae TaxID=2762277 RepID=UPI00193B0437|nr:LUD domain-containing protein [Entomobacter blattae]